MITVYVAMDANPGCINTACRRYSNRPATCQSTSINGRRRFKATHNHAALAVRIAPPECALRARRARPHCSHCAHYLVWLAVTGCGCVYSVHTVWLVPPIVIN